MPRPLEQLGRKPGRASSRFRGIHHESLDDHSLRQILKDSSAYGLACILCAMPLDWTEAEYCPFCTLVLCPACTESDPTCGWVGCVEMQERARTSGTQ